MDKSPSMLRATLIGGSVFGAIGAVPLLGALNCACCALIVGGGFLAAFLYSKECSQSGSGFTPANGALVGLVAGMFYALASAVVGLVFKAILGPPDIEQILGILDQIELPPETTDQITSFMESSAGALGIVLGFFFTLLLAAIFSTLGGLIGGAVFKLEPKAPGGPPTASLGSDSIGSSLEPPDPQGR